jgi:hypothetical protein
MKPDTIQRQYDRLFYGIIAFAVGYFAAHLVIWGGF